MPAGTLKKTYSNFKIALMFCHIGKFNEKNPLYLHLK
jgi:hypothetical protein